MKLPPTSGKRETGTIKSKDVLIQGLKWSGAEVQQSKKQPSWKTGQTHVTGVRLPPPPTPPPSHSSASPLPWLPVQWNRDDNNTVNHKFSRSPPISSQEMQYFPWGFQEHAGVQTRAWVLRAVRPLEAAGWRLLPTVDRGAGAPPLFRAPGSLESTFQMASFKVSGRRKRLPFGYALSHSKAARVSNHFPFSSLYFLWGARAARIGLSTRLMSLLQASGLALWCSDREIYGFLLRVDGDLGAAISTALKDPSSCIQHGEKALETIYWTLGVHHHSKQFYMFLPLWSS